MNRPSTTPAMTSGLEASAIAHNLHKGLCQVLNVPTAATTRGEVFAEHVTHLYSSSEKAGLNE
jgi:hypothetical protein